MYSDIRERILGDIDFLVSEKDYFPTARFLENEGYLMTRECYGRDLENLKHYPRISKPGATADLEIHRLPVAEAYQSLFNTEIIDREKKQGPNLPDCFILSGKHNIIHNYVHS